MPITQTQYNNALSKCDKIWSSIFTYNGGNLMFLPDGTIYTELNNGDGTFTPYQTTKVCCDILKKRLIEQTPPQYPSNVNPNNIYFDFDEQKCRWAQEPKSSCLTNKPIKVVLNPVGNDGAFFTLTENDTCKLEVKFSYLFKIKCEALQDVIRLNGVNNGNNATYLRQLKFVKESELLEVNNELDSLSRQAANLSYSVVCNEFPITQESVISKPTTDITPVQKLPFLNTGFGSLTNSTEVSVSKTKVGPIYETKFVNFCLTEAGLITWRNILGDNNYNEFINGNPKSYTCLDVIKIDKLNQEAIINSQELLIFECTTPFGEKTNLLNKISELAEIQKNLANDINIIDGQIGAIEDIVDSCSTVLGQFQNISASVTLDLINDNNSTTQFYIENFFPTHPNLYNYLTQTQENSGFFVSGEPTLNETWASGTTGLVYPEFTFGNVIEDSDELNVSICKNIKDVLQQELFNSSGQATLESFNSTLSPNVFNSNWLTHSFTIDNQQIITGITNNQIKLNILINSSCDNFCLLIDQINMTKVCDDNNRTNIFISQSPGFEITRIIDNKKSWLQTEQTTDRNFFIANYDDSNKIRQTEYTVDEDRLILNSKEIDLTMNMASAVENDVWCYLAENPNLLSGATGCLKATWGNEVIGTQVFTMQNMGIYNGKKWFSTKSDTGFTVVGEYLTIYFDGSDWVGTQTSSFVTPPALSGDIVSMSSNPSVGLNPPEDGWIAYINSPFGGATIYLDGDSIENIDENCCNSIITCGDNNIIISALTTTDIKEATTLEMFEDILTSELTDVKNRKVISSYPTLKAVYDRYMNATQYGVPKSNEFTYEKMDKFTGLIKDYWNDLIEQVVPATTLWGSIKVYTNTMFDQQKFKYRSYTSLFCNSPLNFVAPPSPINGSSGQCENVEVIVSNITNLPENAVVRMSKPVKYNSICLTQMNWGSEFVGNVNIQDGNGNYLNNDTFCDNV